MSRPSPSSRRAPFAAIFPLAALGVLSSLTTDAEAISRTAIVARAQEWVDAKLLYCVSPKGAYDSTCGYTCNRQDNPAWNPYYSDCPGLITWAWGLGPDACRAALHRQHRPVRGQQVVHHRPP